MALIPRLPSTPALMLSEYAHEPNDYLALHRICGALEITARFLTVLLLADLWEQRPGPEDDFPERLLKTLVRCFKRPTLGDWRVLLAEAVQALPDVEGGKDCLLPELPAYVQRFVDELGAAGQDSLDRLLPMRNELVHSGRLSDDRVTALLKAHASPFESLMLGLAFLASDQGVHLVASPADGPARMLCGWPPTGVEFNCARLPEGFQKAGSDRLLLVTPKRVLDFSPLHAYGQVFQVVQDQLVGRGEEGLHLYVRANETMGAEYTALGTRASHSRGDPVWEKRFAAIFRLEAWRRRFRREEALGRYTFDTRLDDLLELFLGREEQVAAALTLIDQQESGILWVAGKPGMGKSAFMARLVRECALRAELVCIPYFFQASDGDLCRTTSFAEAAILRLGQAAGHTVRVEAEPVRRLQQFKDLLKELASGKLPQIVILVDGLDEIAGVEADFLDLIFACRFPGVLWVCAGRDEERLLERFSREHCHWLFEADSEFPAFRVPATEAGLLPPLKADDVRGFIIEELGHRVPEFFRRDQQIDGMWSNPYVEEVINRSAGLPLYLKLLVNDLKAGRLNFAPGSEDHLPQGLEYYYDRLVEEMGDDLSATVPAITALLALAREPLPLEILSVLLADHELVGQPDGLELLSDALRHSAIMLRRAPAATGVLGYTPYHTSLRQHLLASPHIRRSRVKANERLCNLAKNWRQLPQNSPPLDYALRFGPAHLIEGERWDDWEGRETDLKVIEATCAERWADLEGLLTDLKFIEAKCAAGMTYDLVADYNLALQSLPEAQPEIQKEREHQARGKQYVDDMVAYARAWNEPRDRHAQDPVKYPMPTAEDIPLPEIIPSVEPWSEEKIKAETERILNRPTRLDRVRAFAQFVNSGSHALIKFASHPGFCLQQAWNSAKDGPVSKTAEALVQEEPDYQLLLHHPAQRLPYQPQPALFRTMEGHSKGDVSVALTPDGRRALSGTSDCTLRLWDLDTGACLQALKGHTGTVCSIAVTPDGRRALSGSRDSTLKLWDLETGACLQTMEGYTGWVYSVALTPDGRRALSGSGDRTLRLWDLETGDCLKTLEGHTRSLRSVALTPDGRRALSGSEDKTLRLWDLDTGACLKTLEGHTDYVNSVALTPDGRRALSGSADNTLRLWDLDTVACLKTLEGHTGMVKSVALTPDGRRALSASYDITLRLWDLDKGVCLQNLEGHTERVTSVALAPDGRRALSGSWDKTLRLWDLDTGACLQALKGHTGTVCSIAVTPDGRRVLSASADNTLRLWDLDTGACLKTLEGHTGMVYSVALTPDGRRALSGSGDKTLRLWDLETGVCLQPLKGHYDWVGSIALTPDGRRALSGSADNTLRLWDLETGVCFHGFDKGACLRTLERDTGVGTGVAITPDGRRALSGSRDKNLRLWDLETGACLACYQPMGAVSSLSPIKADGQFVLGSSSGEVIFLRSRNFPQAARQATLVRLWLPGLKAWDRAITISCLWCGQSFPVMEHILELIRAINREAGLRPDQSPCLSLPDEAWEEPRLLSECPLCKKPLKFNPFIVDNRDRY